MGLAGAEKSSTKFFFVISQIMVILALYAIYDEAVVRRPWKHFQEEFNQLELRVAQQKYNDVVAQYKADGSDQKIKKLELELEQAKTDTESADYKNLAQKIKAEQIKYDDQELKIKFNKSILDSYYYEWKHAFQSGHEYKAEEKRYFDLDKQIADMKVVLLSMGADLKKLKEQTDVYDNKVKDLENQIAMLKKPLEDEQKIIDGIKTRVPEILQVVVPNLGIQGNIYWGKVDRCQTCHVAADKAGYENIVDTFKLSVVKDEVALKTALQKNPAKRGFIITEAQQKHYQIMYGTHPNRDALLKNHPVDKFGCTSCHGGDGRGLQIRGLKFGERSKEEKNTSHEETSWGSSGYVQGVFGEIDKVHATHHDGIEPLLRGNQIESNCLACHNGQIDIPEAPQLTKGLTLFVELGCNGCHLSKGYDGLFKAGPELNRVGNKVNADWLVDWLKDPKNYMPNSRMPMFALEDPDVVAVASFLLSQTQDYKLQNQFLGGGDPKNGKELFEDVGCLGCHAADDSEKTYSERERAPNLSRLASKVKSAAWVYDWIKNPKNYSSTARMPSLRLSDSEASDIVAYVMSLSPDYQNIIKQRSGKLAAQVNPNDQNLVKHGKDVMVTRGCYACHSIKGFEGLDRIGPELSSESIKELFKFDFGDALKKDYTFTDEFGKTVYVGHNHEEIGVATAEINKTVTTTQKSDRVTNLVDTWQSWIRNKLRYPQTIFAHTGIVLKMPNFDLSEDEIDALVTFLKAETQKEISPEFNFAKTHGFDQLVAGQRAVKQYNCQGCHSVQNYGAEIVDKIDQKMGAHLTQYYPPSLDAVGEKIRPEWLYEFLKSPKVYRPALKVRMPTFGFDEAQINMLIAYFASMSKVEQKLTDTHYQLSSSNIEEAKKLTGPEVYNCFSCHLVNGKTPGDNPANWAPDWADVRDRLQYDFIPKWIKGTAQYQKYAVMPAFLKSDDEADPSVLGGKAEDQLKALRDLILSMGAAGNK